MSEYNPKLAENIQVASACGLSPRAIAKEFSISEEHLLHLYKEDLDHGLEIANAKVAKTFYDLASSGEHPTLTARWMELRAGWSTSSNLTVKDDTDQELAREKLLKLLNRAHSHTPLKAVK